MAQMDSHDIQTEQRGSSIETGIEVDSGHVTRPGEAM